MNLSQASEVQEGVFVDPRQEPHTRFNAQPFDRDAV